MQNPIDPVLKFLEKINQHDVDGLVSLMSEQPVLVDSLGNRFEGREKLRAGWQSYFKMCPDYTVSHEEIFDHGNIVAVFGSAGGTIAAKGELKAENRWRVPAAWMATVRNGKLEEWRVYADNKPVYEILNRLNR
ncbi:MAG TPA: nuclear transport factor 2 family protein, partial [Terriglobales bacterium]|nr:nuclear transport factor 2 family protein [Terriglobales bacterium]